MKNRIFVTALFMVFAVFANAQEAVSENPDQQQNIAVENDAASIAKTANETANGITSDTAQEIALDYKVSPFDHLGHNMLLSAFGWPLAFHMVGSSATYILSTNDIDLQVARFAARQNEVAYGIAFTPGMAMGTFFPFLVPGYMLFISDNPELNNTGAVAAQATAVAFLYDNILKAISGRAHPEAGKNTGELSRDFDWGFFKRGVFYGWPSGHSMTNAALAMSIASYNRDNPWVVTGCSLYAGYIATSMVLGAKGEAHWFSDAVAGVLMGASIGWYIGNTFYQEKASRGQIAQAPKFIIAPIAYDDHKGAVMSVSF